jgi:alkanesulfonate monooxygenase SsuD/methylene tetrahydromethanopterin reductase-like flavin-dependent oxidoreductase (luciferase family)
MIAKLRHEQFGQLREPERMSLRLSIIDFQHPAMLLELALLAEQLGYYRLWLTEHHTREQSGSPILTAALTAARTSRIRIGTAAVLLNLYEPLKIAEDALHLELFFPGRIDLGIGSAVPPGAIGQELLGSRHRGDRGSYENKVRRLRDLLCLAAMPNTVAETVPGPATNTIPNLWICGTSEQSALLAAELGWGFSFNEHISRHSPAPSNGKRLLDVYKEQFLRYGHTKRPQCNVALYGLCLRDLRAAMERWPKQIEPSFLGSPQQVHEQILNLARWYDTDEIVVQSLSGDWRDRLFSYQAMAKAFALPGSELFEKVDDGADG